MKKIFFNFFIILFGIIIIYFLKTSFSEYNLDRTVSACILAQKQTTKSFDLKKSKKYCEEEVRKKKEDN
tara:strand:+ start:159 stop:365 length:207 start_codon:yes stop_codon:yes gene_type:complete